MRKAISIILFMFICSLSFASVYMEGNQWLEIPHDSTLSPTGDEMSVSVWIKPNFTQTTNINGFIFDKQGLDALGGSREYRLLFSDIVDDWRWIIYTSTGRTILETTGVTWSANTWHNIIVDYDGSNMHFWWDCVLKKTQAKTGNFINNNDILTIGNINSSSAGQNFKGEIDELVMVERVFTAQERENLCKSKVKRMPLQTLDNAMLYLSLDNFSDGSAINTDWPSYIDLSGNDNNAVGHDLTGAGRNRASTNLSY